MKLKKRGMNGTEIFIYVLGIMIAGFILLIGYKAIGKFLTTQDDVLILEFSKELGSKVKTISSQYGSEKFVTISVPSKTKYVCFINSSIITQGNTRIKFSGDIDSDSKNIIEDSITSKVNNQVFLFTDKPNPFNMGWIEVEGDVLCLKPINSNLMLKLEGTGNFTVVSDGSEI